MDREFDLTELLLAKRFEELDTREKAFVLTQVEGANEYNHLRNIVTHSKDESEMQPESKEKIMAAFDAEFEAESKKSFGWIKKYGPYIAAAASVAVLLIIGTIFLKNNENQLAEKKPVDKAEHSVEDSTVNSKSFEDKTEDEDTVKIKSEGLDQIAELKELEESTEGESSKSKDLGLEPESSAIKEVEADEVNESIAVIEEPDSQGYDAVEKDESQYDLYRDNHTIGDDEVAVQEEKVNSTANEQASVAAVQSMRQNSLRKKERKMPEPDLFKIKRIKKDHFTSY